MQDPTSENMAKQPKNQRLGVRLHVSVIVYSRLRVTLPVLGIPNDLGAARLSRSSVVFSDRLSLYLPRGWFLAVGKVLSRSHHGLQGHHTQVYGGKDPQIRVGTCKPSE